MNTVKNKLSDTKLELVVTLGKDELEVARLAALGKMAKDVKVPGFRSGKAPANIVEKHVDPNKLAEATLEGAVNRAVAEAYMGEGIQPLDRPNVEVTKYVPGETLEFKATSEILPEIKLGNYKKLTAKKAKVDVTEKEVKEVLTNIQNSFAEKKEVKRAAKNGDEVVIDFVGKKDGEAFDGGTGKDYALKLGSKSFIPGFEDGVVGHKAGEEFDIDLKFPDDYHAENLKGQKAVFTVSLKKVQEIKLPEVDDKLAAKCGPFKIAKELTDDIKKSLKHQKEHEATEKLKDELVGDLVKKSTVPAPEVLVQDQIASIKQDMVQNLTYRGLKLEDYLASQGKTEEEWVKNDIAKVAETRIKAGLVLAELARELKIEVSDDDIDQKVKELSTAYEKNPDAVKQLKTPEVRADIRNRLITEKTVEELMKINKL